MLTICLIFTFAACTASEQPQATDTNSPAADDNSAGAETPGDADSTDIDTDQTETKPSTSDKDNISRSDAPTSPLNLLNTVIAFIIFGTETKMTPKSGV